MVNSLRSRIISTFKRSFSLFVLIGLFALAKPEMLSAQTLSDITTANDASNGITQGPLFKNQTDVIVFGFKITVTGGGTLTANNVQISTTGNEGSYFSNFRLFRSNDAVFNVTADTQIGAGSSWNGTIDIPTGSTAFTTGDHYLFLAADFTGTGALPNNMQFFIAAGTGGTTLRSGGTYYDAFNVSGTTYTLQGPEYTMININTPANGVTPAGTLVDGQSYTLFGFGLTVKGVVSIQEFNIYNTVNVTNYFGSGRIYRSNDAYFDATDVQVGTVTYNGNYARATGLTETFNNITTGTTQYYFIQGTYTAGTAGTTQFKFQSTQSPYSAIILSDWTTVNSFNMDGATYTLPKVCKWRGWGTTNFNDGGQWLGGLPGPADMAFIGDVDFGANSPVVTGNITVGSIVFGSVKPTNLVISSGTLTVKEAIIVPNVANGSIGIALNGPGNIITENIQIGGGKKPTANATTTLTSTVPFLTVNQSVLLQSQTNGSFKNDASFLLPTGTVDIKGGIQTINEGAANTSTFSLNTGAKAATLSFSGNSVFNLSATGTNTLDFRGNATPVTYNNAGAQQVATGTYNNLTIQGSGTKTIIPGTLSVAGDLTLNAPATMAHSGSKSNSSIELVAVKGTGNINFLSDVPVTTSGDWDNTLSGKIAGTVTYNSTLTNQQVGALEYGNIAFKGGGTKNLLNLTQVSGELSVDPGTTLQTNDKLKLIAGKDKNANIKALATTAIINGKVAVQVYVDGKGNRSNLMFSAPVQGFTFKQLQTWLPVSGIKGTTAGSGFDTNTGNTYKGATITYYNEPKKPTEVQYLTPASINEGIATGKSFFFMFRGNRGNMDAKFVGPYPAPEPVTIEYTGNINRDDITVNLSYTNWSDANDGFNMLGNPYPSTIDFKKLTKPATVTKMYIFDPLSQNYSVYDELTPGASTLGATQFVAPGQGFWVQATDAGQNIKFTESSKITDISTEVPARFMTANNLKLMSTSTIRPSGTTKTAIAKITVKQGENTADGTVIVIREGSDSKKTHEDARYLTGSGNLSLNSLSSDEQNLAINYIPHTDEDIEVRLNVSAKASGSYILNLSDFSTMNRKDVFLEDKYTGSTIDFKANPVYPFTIDKTVSSSFGSDRFKIVFKPLQTLPISILSYTAKKVKAGAELKWTTTVEKNSDYFEVERSADGKIFTTLAQIKAVGNSSASSNYYYLDENPLNGINYYRLKQVDLNEKSTYSDLTSLNYMIVQNKEILDDAVPFKVYPNPAKDDLFIHLTDQKNPVVVKIFNMAGKELKRSVVNETSNIRHNISDLPKGIYIIQVVDSKSNAILKRERFIKE